MPAVMTAEAKPIPGSADGSADGSAQPETVGAVARPASCAASPSCTSDVAGVRVGCRPCVTKCQTNTVAPTSAFKPAASATVCDPPSQRIRNRPAQKHAAAEPRVLAAYSAPTDVPTFREKRTA